jgi:hypothetical protein
MFKRLDDNFIWDHKTIGTFFLGVGFIMFVLNITSIIQVINIEGAYYPMSGYYISVLSSMFLMGYSLYNIYKENI